MRWVSFFSLIAVVFVSAACRRQEPAPKQVVEVTTAVAEEREWATSVSGPATLYPRQQASVSSKISAPIHELRVTKGASVRRDQVLAVLANRDLESARAEAQFAVAEAETALERLSASTLPAELERARAQLQAAEAALNTAQKIYDRRKALYEEGAIPQRELLVSQAELASAKSNFDVARKNLDLFQTQSRGQDLKLARARLDQAQARLRQAEAQLSFTVLQSPFDGLITEQFLYPGDMAKPESPVFVVMDVGSLIARGQISASEAAAIKPLQKAEFTGRDTGPARFDGAVKMVNAAIDPARRTVEVWAEFQPDRRLRPGAFGTLELITGAPQKRVAVPTKAVLLEEGTNKGTVMVVDSQNIAHARQVQAGMSRDDRIEIVTGVKRGETVVVEGAYGLPDNTEVKRK